MRKRIFVASTGQHVGKTTSTLGLVATLHSRGLNVGFCKPVGQQYVTVDGVTADKDAILYGKTLSFEVDPTVHSPVILGKGATSSFLNDPGSYSYDEDILNAARELEKRHDIVVYEGTGHSGVGSVVNLSNARVAKLLKAGVVIVVEGGIGNTIDQLNLNLALFREYEVPVIGVIVNKVKPDKRDKVEHFVQKWLDQMRIPLLGVMPYDRILSFPIIATICRAVEGKIMFSSRNLRNYVEEIVAGSLLDSEDELSSYKNLLLVVSLKRYKAAVKKIKSIAEEKKLEECPLAGVLITGDGRRDTWYEKKDLMDDYLHDNLVPVLTTPLDTYGSVVKISKIEVKINTHTPWKVRRAVELIQKNVDLERILSDG